MKYTIKWKHKSHWFWRTERGCIGHVYKPDHHRLIISKTGGRMREIPDWLQCHLKGGPDLFAATKEAMERDAGQTVPVKTL